MLTFAGKTSAKHQNSTNICQTKQTNSAHLAGVLDLQALEHFGFLGAELAIGQVDAAEAWGQNYLNFILKFEVFSMGCSIHKM